LMSLPDEFGPERHSDIAATDDEGAQAHHKWLTKPRNKIKPVR
jgi:hypothetical protein